MDCGGDEYVRYFAQYDTEGVLTSIGTGPGGIEITEAEYNSLLSEIRKKADIVTKLYNNEITIEDVPTEWREEIQRRVNERIEQEGATSEQLVSGDEFLSMMEGVL